MIIEIPDWNDPKIIISHRGGSMECPENTL